MNDNPILLVEDNQDDQHLALRAFRKSNLTNQVIIANDGVEALDYLFATGPHSGMAPLVPAVILLDLKLPRKDGLQVLREIRADPRTRYFPVVILTSSREEQDMINGYQLGANSYVRKPIDFNEFVSAVGNLGLYWLLLNETIESRT